uniref:Uncharacterized protein n=1 Tax=Anguilla anguilla TaxID=7936 RepID=A0A0E9SS66_ANGAN
MRYTEQSYYLRSYFAAPVQMFKKKNIYIYNKIQFPLVSV